MNIIKVSKNDAGQRLDKFLTKSMPSLPMSLMYKFIRTKKIKVNRKKCEPSRKLLENDEVILFISDEFFVKNESFPFLSLTPKIDVVYEDDNIIIVNKKVGMVVHSDENESVDTLINHILAYLYRKGEYDPEKENSFTPALCNRIDRNTQGLVIGAKNAEALRSMNEIIKERKLTKKYLCAAHGIFEKKEDTLMAFIEKNSDENIVRISKKHTDGMKKIVTGYKVVSEKDGISLLDVDLITGRTHQIRAHLSYIGHPLVGDGKYGENKDDRKIGYKHQALCSYYIRFDDSIEGALSSLSGKTIELDKEKIYFIKELFG